MTAKAGLNTFVPLPLPEFPNMVKQKIGRLDIKLHIKAVLRDTYWVKMVL